MFEELRRALGGGNRHGVRDVVRGADLAAKRDLDAKRQRCEDAESVTELILENSSDEYESIVGWAYQPNNETTPRSLKKAAFTLAEVLITLGIIGVVAAITMPILLNNVQGQVKAKRIENIRQKLSKVTDKMAVQSGLMGYGDATAFVQELQKHMKIAKVCDNNNLEGCWPTKEVVLNDEGKTWEIAKTKTAKTLKISDSVKGDWSDTVGIVTADGTAMILSYDKSCDFDVDKDGLKFNQSGAISSSTNCISGVYDWNGGSKPNKLGQDVLTLGMASGLGSECAIEIGDKCFTAPVQPKALTRSECEGQKGKLGIKECVVDNDYWAGAVAQCGGVQNMPTAEDLAKLATQIYKEKPIIEVSKNVYNLTLDTSTASSMGFDVTHTTSCIWSGEEVNGYNAKNRGFSHSRTTYNCGTRNISSIGLFCLGG